MMPGKDKYEPDESEQRPLEDEGPELDPDEDWEEDYWEEEDEGPEVIIIDHSGDSASSGDDDMPFWQTFTLSVVGPLLLIIVGAWAKRKFSSKSASNPAEEDRPKSEKTQYRRR